MTRCYLHSSPVSLQKKTRLFPNWKQNTPTVAKVTWNNDLMVLAIEGPKRDLTDNDTNNDIGVGNQYSLASLNLQRYWGHSS